jgi:hypothetical protein
LQYTELTDDPFVARLARYLPAARSTGEGMNRVNIPAWAIDLGKSRSGLCALTAESTALIVVDLQNAFLAPGETLANPHARDIVSNVNAIARALRGSMAAVFAGVRDTKATIELIRSAPAAPVGAATARRDCGEDGARERTLSERH